MSAPEYYPLDADVPASLEAERWVLTMLSAGHNDLDYVAVLASSDRLQVRSRGRWPREGFTSAENLADLERHEEEHRSRVAFTYTILDPVASRCLGCLYLRPVRHLLERGVVTEGALPPRDHTTTADFWTVPELVVAEPELLEALTRWLRADWSFHRVYWTTTEGDTEQAALFRRTLDEAFVVEGTDGVVYLGFTGLS